MKKLLIIGARGYGRGTVDIAKLMPDYEKKFIIKGFLDDNKNILDKYPNYPPIISSVENYIVEEDDVFVCALGDVSYKKKYVTMILEKGGEFYTIIHPATHIGNNVKIGNGCIIGYNTQIDCDVTIGDFVNIQTNVVVGHDSVIGNWTIMDCFSFTGGFAQLGDSVTVHTGAKILPHRIIGKNSTINAGSIVIRDVKDNSVIMGNPAKELLIPKIK